MRSCGQILLIMILFGVLGILSETNVFKTPEVLTISCYSFKDAARSENKFAICVNRQN